MSASTFHTCTIIMITFLIMTLIQKSAKNSCIFATAKKSIWAIHSFLLTSYFMACWKKWINFHELRQKKYFDWLLCSLAAGRTIGIPDTWQLWKARLPTFLCHKAVDRAERHQSDNILWTLWLFVKQSNMTVDTIVSLLILISHHHA